MPDIQPPGPYGATADERCEVDLQRELHLLFAGLDPVPAEVITAAKSALIWRTVDADLAELTDDSALAGTTGIRGDGATRLLAFEAPGVAVVIEVEVQGDRRRLLGQLLWTGGGQTGSGTVEGAEIELRRPAPARPGPPGPHHVRTDELGRFRVETVAGPLSLAVRCVREAGPTEVVTGWVTV